MEELPLQFYPRSPQPEESHYNVKINARRSCAPVVLTLCLAPGERTKGFRRHKKSCPEPGARRDTSKDDRRKRKRHNGSRSQPVEWNQLRTATTVRLQFAVAANSFFSILVFNDLLRGPDHGSMALVPQNSAPALPVSLGASIRQLAVEKLPSGAGFDLAVRDDKTGFVFFNVEGDQYDYDANAKLLSITGGRLLVSNEFAKALGRPVSRRGSCGRNLHRRNHATDRDQSSRRKRRM